MCRAARIYGYFVPPKTWVPMVSQRLLAQALDTDLMILSHIIIGSDPQLLRGSLEDLSMTLQDDSVALTLNVRILLKYSIIKLLHSDVVRNKHSILVPILKY